MKTMYDIRKLLKKYGVFIYTGNRIGDIDLMEIEIRDLYNLNILPIKAYQQALLILRHEKSSLSNN